MIMFFSNLYTRTTVLHVHVKVFRGKSAHVSWAFLYSFFQIHSILSYISLVPFLVNLYTKDHAKIKN